MLTNVHFGICRDERSELVVFYSCVHSSTPLYTVSLSQLVVLLLQLYHMPDTVVDLDLDH
jgi:hypothetical protein